MSKLPVKEKTYYLYKLKRGKRIYKATIRVAGDDDAVRVYVKEHYPKLKSWDALLKKYVSDKTTGAMQGPPYPYDTTDPNWMERVKRRKTR